MSLNQSPKRKRVATESDKRWKIEWQRKKAASRTEKEKELFNAYHRAWKLKKRASMTEDEKREAAKKHSADCLRIANGHSEEKKAQVRESKRKWMAAKRQADRAADRKKKQEYTRLKRATSPEFVIGERLRGHLRKAVVRAGMKEMKPRTMELAGCTRAELRRHIESQFQPGMTWENYGYTGWHIDHRKPVSSFNLLNESEMRACFHFSNLQPMWGVENMRKGNRFAA